MVDSTTARGSGVRIYWLLASAYLYNNGIRAYSSPFLVTIVVGGLVVPKVAARGTSAE